MNTTEFEQMETKDSYMLLLNLAMVDTNSINLWNDLAKKSYCHFQFNDKIEDEFEIFNNWNNEKNAIPNNKFLSNLFYGLRLNNVDQKKAHDYLNIALIDFFLFLTENIYLRITSNLIKDKNFSTIYNHFIDGQEAYWFDLLMHKMQSYVKIDYSKFEKYTKIYKEFYQNPAKILRLLEEELTITFNNKQHVNLKNIFHDNCENMILDTSEKIVIGINTSGSIYAISQILKQKNPYNYTLILFGGLNALYDTYGQKHKDYYKQLSKQKVKLVCVYSSYGFQYESTLKYELNIHLLDENYYSPFTLKTHNYQLYYYIFLHCLKKTPNIINIMAEKCKVITI